MLALLAVASLAVAAAPSAAHAQRVDSRDCTTRTEWRDWDACMRRRDSDIGAEARRSAVRASADARARVNANQARNASRREESVARAERKAWARESAIIERAERDRARASERTYRRRGYTRDW
jgi:hypothetical protein